MYSTDPHFALGLHRQRSRTMRDQAAADALARRVGRRHEVPSRESWWRFAHRRRRAPVTP